MIPGCWFSFWNEMGAASALIRAAPHGWEGGRERKRNQTVTITIWNVLLKGYCLNSCGSPYFWYSLVFHSQAYGNEFQAMLAAE